VIKLSVVLQLSGDAFRGLVRDIKQSVANVAGVDVSRVTVYSVAEVQDARRRLLSTALEVQFRIQTPAEETGDTSPAAVAEALTSGNLQAEMMRFEALTSIADTVVVVSVVLVIPPGDVPEAISTLLLWGVVGGASALLIAIVVGVVLCVCCCRKTSGAVQVRKRGSGPQAPYGVLPAAAGMSARAGIPVGIPVGYNQTLWQPQVLARHQHAFFPGTHPRQQQHKTTTIQLSTFA
jgi:hypothetical protein